MLASIRVLLLGNYLNSLRPQKFAIDKMRKNNASHLVLSLELKQIAYFFKKHQVDLWWSKKRYFPHTFSNMAPNDHHSPYKDLGSAVHCLALCWKEGP